MDIYIYICTHYSYRLQQTQRKGAQIFEQPAVTSQDQASGFGRYTQMDGSCYEGAAVVQSSW